MATCLACAAPDPPLRCTGCTVARFCGQQCQRAVWSGHKSSCRDSGGKSLEAAGIARAAAAAAATSGSGALDEDAVMRLLPDAEVQARVLLALGIREGGVVGQRPFSGGELCQLLQSAPTGLARRLFGRNGFRESFLPALRALDQQNLWPAVLSMQPQGNLTELPTLELCAAIVVRLLCLARQLHEAGQKRLTFVGIGSGDALMEASVALHLAAVLGLPVDLQADPPVRLQYALDFEICIVATDTADHLERTRNNTLHAREQMRVLRLDRREAVKRFAADGPIYVFSCWMPMRSAWRADIEEDGGLRIAEICFLTAPPALIQNSPGEFRSRLRPTTQLFPLTLSRFDYLVYGLEDASGAELGLYNSQLYLLTNTSTLKPFLAAPLQHKLGSVEDRVKAHKTFEAITVARGFGMSHIRSPEDLEKPIPDPVLNGLRMSLQKTVTQADREALKQKISDCISFLRGTAQRQMAALHQQIA